MGDVELLEELLSEAELAVQHHRVKQQHRGNISSFINSNQLSQNHLSNQSINTLSNGSNLQNSFLFSGTRDYDSTTDGLEVPKINFQDASTIDEQSNCSVKSQDVSALVQQVLGVSSTKTDIDICNRSSLTQASGENEVSVFTAASVLEELREVCWLLLSTANSALRECARLYRQVESQQRLLSPDEGRLKGTQVVKVLEDVSSSQEKAAQAAARMQHLLVEVVVLEQRAGEGEAECQRLCSQLIALLQHISTSLKAAGLAHLEGTTPPLISPRRTNVQRQVEAACSSLELLQQEVQRCKQLQQEQEQRVQLLQRHVREAEERAQEATNKLVLCEAEQRDTARQQQQMLQQAFLELARAEDQLKQTQSEKGAEVQALTEHQQQQQTTITQLREEMTATQDRLHQSTSLARDLKAQYDHLQQETQGRLEELTARAEALQQERDQEQAAAESCERAAQASVAAAREERDAALSKAVLLQGHLESAKQLNDKLQGQLDERLAMQEEINSSLLAVQDQFNDCKKMHDHELQILHDKLSEQGSSLCECQQQLRREELTSLQQRTQLQLEQQRAQQLREHNTALLKQIDDLNKTLRDQIDQKMSDNVRQVLKSLQDMKPSPDNKHQQHVSLRESYSTLQQHDSQPATPHSGSVYDDLQQQRQQRSQSVDATSALHSGSNNNNNNNNSLSSGRGLVAQSTPSLHVVGLSHGIHGSISDRQSYSAPSPSAAVPLDLSSQLERLEMMEKSMLEFANGASQGDDDDDKDVCDDRRGADRWCIGRSVMNTSYSARSEPVDLSSRRPASSTVRGDVSQRYDSKNLSKSTLNIGSHSVGYSSPNSSSKESFSRTQSSPLNLRKGAYGTSSVLGVTSCRSASSCPSRDSGLDTDPLQTSSSSPDGGDDASELRRARAEARAERLEAAKLREKCALLQVEVNTHKNALDDERSRVRMKTRINRVKREEFGQLLGSLEESVERFSDTSSVGNLTEDNLHRHTTARQISGGAYGGNTGGAYGGNTSSVYSTNSHAYDSHNSALHSTVNITGGSSTAAGRDKDTDEYSGAGKQDMLNATTPCSQYEELVPATITSSDGREHGVLALEGGGEDASEGQKP